MKRHYFSWFALFTMSIAIVLAISPAWAENNSGAEDSPPDARLKTIDSVLEELLQKSSTFESVEGFASYYARKFEGRRTSSGQRYNPDKLTAAHQSLPLGTVVRVLNPATGQDVQVTVNDRCAPKSFHFIDLSRAAAKRIGLWGKGKIRVVIIPLEEPA